MVTLVKLRSVHGGCIVARSQTVEFAAQWYMAWRIAKVEYVAGYILSNLIMDV